MLKRWFLLAVGLMPLLSLADLARADSLSASFDISSSNGIIVSPIGTMDMTLNPDGSIGSSLASNKTIAVATTLLLVTSPCQARNLSVPYMNWSAWG